MSAAHRLVLACAIFACACGAESAGGYVPKELPDRRGQPIAERAVPTPKEAAADKPPAPLARKMRRASRPTETRLSNGIRVLMLERHDFPAATVGLVLDRGAASAPSGVASLYAEAIRGSSGEHSRKDAFGYLRYIGATTRTWATRDAVSISTTALSPFVWGAFERVAPMMTKPLFESEDLADARTSARADAAIERERGTDKARAAMFEMLFPSGHPYGRTTSAWDDARYEKMSKNELESFQSMFVVAERVSVVAVGDFSPKELVRQLEKRLRGLPKKKAGVPPEPPPIQRPARARITIIDRKGASQSNVAIGFSGARRAEQVHAPLAILQSMLGRGLSGRLNLKVRGEHGATYGVHMRDHAWRDGGAIEVFAAIDTQATAKALSGLMTELARVRTEAVEDAELTRAKAHAIDSAIDVDSYGSLASLAGAGLPLDHWDKLEMAIAAQSSEDVQQAAATYLATDVAQIAIVGDADAIATPLRALNIGEVTIKPP